MFKLEGANHRVTTNGRAAIHSLHRKSTAFSKTERWSHGGWIWLVGQALSTNPCDMHPLKTPSRRWRSPCPWQSDDPMTVLSAHKIIIPNVALPKIHIYMLSICSKRGEEHTNKDMTYKDVNGFWNNICIDH